MTSPDAGLAGACGDTAPAGAPATRRILDQYLYTSHAHLESVVLAYKSGRNLESSLAAAERHLDTYLKDRP